MVKRTFLGKKPWLCAAALLLAIPAACTPAERQFGSGGGGATSTSSSTASSSSASSWSSASSSSAGTGGGATSSSSAGTGGSGGAACPTDADKDGYDSLACGGQDCADNDPSAYPGQTMWFTTPIKGTTSFDYNCDGKEEIQFVEVIKCDLLNCDTNTKKWAVPSPPPCGATADFGACQMSGLMCVPIITGQRTQGCR